MNAVLTTARGMARSFGVLDERGVANRWTVYVRIDGRVAKIQKDVDPGTAGVVLTETLAELNFPHR